MSDKFFDKAIGRLKNVYPAPSDPADLTNRIMDMIEKPVIPDRKILSIRISHRHWLFVNGFRILSTAAAILMILFFILEQKQMNLKIEKLQAQVSRQADQSDHMNVRVAYRYPDSLEDQISFPRDSVMNNIFINRRSLDYLIQKIRELEEENKTLRDRIIDTYDLQNQN